MTEIRGWSEVVVPALATVAVLILALLIRARASGKPRRQLPPGPRGWPLVGSLHLLGILPHQSLFELSKKYGPLMFMHLGSVKTIVVTSPRMAQAILKTHDKVMASRPVQIAAEHFFYSAQDIGFAPYGPYWRYVRKVCTLGLLTAKRINHFKEIREREVMAILHFILEESQRGYAVNMTECFTTMTFNNITQMMMNQSYCAPTSGSKSALREVSTAVLSEYIKEMFLLLGAFNLADYIPLLKSLDLQGFQKRTEDVQRKIDKFLEEVIEMHRQRGSTANTETYKEDFVDALLAFGQTTEFNERLCVEAVKAIMLDMIAAGGDTSSATMLWALSELVKNPHMLRKAQEELDSVVGRHRLVQEEDLPNLHYMNAVVKETLRLHTPGPLSIPHESTEDCEIEGFHVPAGTRVLVNLWGVHRDPAVWERPLEFDPERFLTSSSKDFKGQSFEFIPFSAGRRMCPGMNLGLLMVMYPLSVLLHALDWTLPDGQKCEEVDLSETLGLVLYKRVPLTVFGQARLPNHVLYPAAQQPKQGQQ